ncbi:MAG: MATE family efflux transporter [Clostridia bacterium]|nr:MATE family efflux transporter [Clostridia bacterium]
MEEEEVKPKENRMGTMSVWKLLLVVGVPMILSLAVQSLYNIMDSFFVSRMPTAAGDSAAALTALGYCFPIQMIMIGIGIGLGVGSNAAISRALGEGDKKKADRIVGNTIFLGFIIYAVFLIFGATPLVNLYVKIYKSADENVVSYTVSYLRICCCLSIFNLYFNLYEKILQSTGKSSFTMISQVSGAVINIILDPIFISTMGLGITGAAIATILGQFIGFALNFIFHLRFNRELGNSVKNWKPSGKIIKEIFRVGLAAIISQVLMAVLTIVMGVFLTRADNRFFLYVNEEGKELYSASYASAYSTFFKVQQFSLFMAFGVRDAVTPIMAYNHGQGKKKRVRQTMWYGFLYTLILMVVCTIVVETATEPLMKLFAEGFSSGKDCFGNDVSTLEICTKAARLIGISFVFAGICIMCQGVYQALEAGTSSLVVSVCRQAAIVIPIVAIATSLMVKRNSRDLEWLLWVSFIISEAVTAVIAVIFLRIIYKKKVSPIREEGEENGETEDAIMTV